jgi:ADP-ribosylglycohydrolase
LTFCLGESLCHGYNIRDIADKFCKWRHKAYWTPYGEVFDIGDTTREAIKSLSGRLRYNLSLSDAGSKINPTNGSLMRILPMSFYTKNMDEKRFEIVHEVSALTHAHPFAIISCGIYNEMAINLLKGENIKDAYLNAVKTSKEYYKASEYAKELSGFKRILDGNINLLPKEQIKSGGYVVNTLEAALWCLLNHDSYRDTVLEAVNLGEDTDTTAAVAGGLAGIYYGIENIPESWIDKIARREDIIELAERLDNYLSVH